MFTVIGAILILSVPFGKGTVIVDKLKADADEVNSMGTTGTARTEELIRQTEHSLTDTPEKRPDDNGSQNTEEILSTRDCLGICGKREKTDTDSVSEYGSAPNHVNVNIPSEFDARQNWPNCESIAYIYNQGNCPSSWAVGAVSVFTDRVCILTGGRITAPRSSHQVMSCCKACGTPCSTSSFSLEEAWHYMRTEGVVTGSNYNSKQGCQPYKMQPCAVNDKAQPSNEKLPICSSLPLPEFKCKTSCDDSKMNFKKDNIKVKTVYKLMTERAVQLELMEEGPVAHRTALYDNFYSYKSGVYKEPRGQKIGDHVVRVIGWGVTEKNEKYWLITGSFGTGWGDNGIGKILRQDNMYYGTFYSGSVVVPPIS